MTSFSKPKITRIKVDYYDNGDKYTNKYYNTFYLQGSEYYDKNILKCEIKFRYKFIIYTHIMRGDITITDIYKEISRILKKEFINERHSV